MTTAVSHAMAAFDAIKHRERRKKCVWGDADIAEICGGEARTTHTWQLDNT